MQRLWRLLLVIGLAAASTGPVVAQSARLVRDLAPGRYLVARRGMLDPNFAEAVILMAHYDEKGALGLIVNRATRLPLSMVFKDIEGAKDRDDPIFLGGPVSPVSVLALMRSRSGTNQAEHVLDDVYLVSKIETLERALADHLKPAAFRVFMGYAGWGAGQLDGEVRMGMWHIFEGEGGIAFDPKPDSLWERLIGLTEMRLARRLPAPRR